MGTDEHYGGLLGPWPHDINKGMFSCPNPPPVVPHDDAISMNCHSPPFPKMEFPKFDIDSARFWCD